MIVGPLSRFGDTAANAGILAICEGVLPVGASTMLASAGAAAWRILTQPVQNVKTLMQVEGAAGIGIMVSKVSSGGVGALWEGAFGTMGATWLGHYPWCVRAAAVVDRAAVLPSHLAHTRSLCCVAVVTGFAHCLCVSARAALLFTSSLIRFVTYNQLNSLIPDTYTGGAKLTRNAVIGFCSSFVSDCVSNSIRVITTAKQTSTVTVGYLQVANGSAFPTGHLTANRHVHV
eukprot:COSAG06_NODE_515_length_14818_cov_1329.391263_11_plen_231_part_00